MGVGDVDEVHGGARRTGYSTCGDDGRRARGEFNTRLVDRCCRTELDSSKQSSGHGIGISDGARIEHGAGDIHGACTRGADRMRGDRVGVGDVSEMPGRARVSGHSAGGDDCG